MSQQFDSGNDAILAEWKSTNAMIASRAQTPRALIALNHRGILGMVATVHHLDFLTGSCARCSPVYRPSCLCVGRCSVSAGGVLAVFVRDSRLFSLARPGGFATVRPSFPR